MAGRVRQSDVEELKAKLDIVEVAQLLLVGAGQELGLEELFLLLDRHDLPLGQPHFAFHRVTLESEHHHQRPGRPESTQARQGRPGGGAGGSFAGRYLGGRGAGEGGDCMEPGDERSALGAD